MALAEISTVVKGSAIGSAVAISAFKVVELFLSEKFKHWRLKQQLKLKDKRSLAENIMAICAEGLSSYWTKPPRDTEHIIHIGLVAKKYDEEFPQKISEYSVHWLEVVSIRQTEGVNENTIKRIKALEKKLIILKNELADWADKLKE